MWNSLTIEILAALAGGFLAGWLIAALRGRASQAAILRETEGLLRGEQATAIELRKQLDSTKAELEIQRSKLNEERGLRVAAEVAATKMRENVEEQRNALDEAKRTLTHTFQALASEALSHNNEQFVKLAQAKFETLQSTAAGDLEGRRTAIQGLVDPLTQNVKDLQQALNQVESSRQNAYGELRSKIEELAANSKDLRQETGNLVNSLRQPQVKGRWGELTLRRTVELAGLNDHCDFEEQQQVSTEDGLLRPDLIVRLPGGSNIVVDAKAPLHAFMKVVASQSDQEYRDAMVEHARLLRGHVNRLSAKEYWKQFEPTPDLVVMFVPGESFFSAALVQDHELIADAIQKKVVLASPTTLIALLRAIAYGWKQERMAANAEQIQSLGTELYDRVLKFAEYMVELSKALERANGAYNRAAGSFDSRLAPSARKFKELGAAAGEDIPRLEALDISPRAVLTGPNDVEG